MLAHHLAEHADIHDRDIVGDTTIFLFHSTDGVQLLLGDGAASFCLIQKSRSVLKEAG
jgi:hypothetical protein